MSRYLKQQYQKLEAYTPGEQPRDMQYIKLNTNESPYPPAPSVVAALNQEQVEQLRLYSDPTAKGLKEKLADLYGVESENIFLSNGSDDILNFAFMAFGTDGAIFPDITYGFYPVFAELHGIPYEEKPLTVDFTVNKEDYIAKNQLIVIANPNAPTGISLPLETIEEIVKSNPDHVVVIDEAYVDFGGKSCYRLCERYDNLLVVRTFSKSRCLAGGRLGYAIGPKGLIGDLEKIKYSTNPYNINRLTMRLGEATVEAEEYYLEKCRAIVEVREQTAERLQELGFAVLPSDANFIFAKSTRISGEALYNELKKRGILVRHFTKERIKDFNRITIGTAEQMKIFCRTVAEILEEQA
ncbi:MAG: histidinol-phosphate transaminase [Clostridia bacterium]|nr:histidinol-phosphate transaminase [Clostridia bacterium]